MQTNKEKLSHALALLEGWRSNAEWAAKISSGVLICAYRHEAKNYAHLFDILQSIDGEEK